MSIILARLGFGADQAEGARGGGAFAKVAKPRLLV